MTRLLLQELLRPGRRVWLTRRGGPDRSVRATRGERAVPDYFRARPAFLAALAARTADAADPSQPPLPPAAPATPETRGRRHVVLFGGIGRMEPQYRALVQQSGYELLYRERRVLGGSPPTTLAGVLVVTSVVSHPLREHAARLAESCRVPIVYLRTPSLEAVRRGLAELPVQR